MSLVISTSPAGRWQARFDAVPPLAWLALQAGALWAHWRWAAARVADGSDDPRQILVLLIGTTVVDAYQDCPPEELALAEEVYERYLLRLG